MTTKIVQRSRSMLKQLEVKQTTAEISDSFTTEVVDLSRSYAWFPPAYLLVLCSKQCGIRWRGESDLTSRGFYRDVSAVYAMDLCLSLTNRCPIKTTKHIVTKQTWILYFSGAKDLGEVPMRSFLREGRKILSTRV